MPVEAREGEALDGGEGRDRGGTFEDEPQPPRQIPHEARAAARAGGHELDERGRLGGQDHDDEGPHRVLHRERRAERDACERERARPARPRGSQVQRQSERAQSRDRHICHDVGAVVNEAASAHEQHAAQQRQRRPEA